MANSAFVYTNLTNQRPFKNQENAPHIHVYLFSVAVVPRPSLFATMYRVSQNTLFQNWKIFFSDLVMVT